MPKLSVHDMKGKVVGDVSLKDEVFDVPYNEGLIHQIFVGLMANKRRGTHSTKTRGEIRGGGRKPWRQKGTGMARAGTKTSPLWRGGGIVFGPRPRGYQKGLPKKMRHGAMRSALSQRVREEKLTALDQVTMEEYKTKTMVKMLSDLKIEDRRTLLVLHEKDDKVIKSASNIPGFNVVLAENLNLLDVVKNHRVLATKDALEKIQEVLS